MLHALHLKNFALIDEYDLQLPAGFTVITGETGAGKSLILDALALCLGGRADSDWVRFGAQSAEVCASFDDLTPQVQQWFTKHEREYEQPITIRRQISATGRSKAWINGMPASLTELKSLGALLVHIHSQHAGLALLKPQFIGAWLDHTAKLHEQSQAVRRAFLAWQKLHDQAMQAKQNAAAKQDRIHLLQNQLADIAPLLGVDLAATNARFDELSNVESLTEDALQAHALLDGDDDAPHALQLLGRAIKLCENNSALSPVFLQAHHNLSEAYEIIKDTWSSLGDYADHTHLDGEELSELSELLALSHRLAHKYRAPIETLIQESKNAQQELDTLLAQIDPSLEEKAKQAYKAYKELALQLHESRLQAAPLLCQTLQNHLKTLALPHATLEFCFTKSAPKPTGLYDIELLFSANVGMPLQPLHKIASGGELSRIALIMQVMRAKDTHQLPLLVFDEVDVGISGGTAQVVGALLQELGQNQQLIAITHQAQVAAFGDAHLLVKKQHDNQTKSTLCLLSHDERIAELARMSGGVQISQETLAHAKILLQQSTQHDFTTQNPD